MKTKNVLQIVAVAISSVVITSCSETDNGNVEYIPYQETTDGQWGMISMDGKVLFSDEFKNKPTVVRDGRFFVRTKEGVWEMYDATEKPKKIGADYAHTSGFRNGIALVAEKNKAVSIIDVDGKTIKTLDKIEGKLIDGVRAFEEGYAAFMTTDSLWGVINQSGKCVVKPEYYSLNNYGDGKFIGVNAKYRDAVNKGKKDKTKISVIDTDGKVLLEFSGDKYENIQNQFSDGLIGVSVKKDGKETWGIINDKGETIVKPSTKIKNIGTIHGETFTYYNGEGWGLMNTKGETLIRAKYEWLYYDQGNTLLAVVKDGDTYQFKYIDDKDDQISDDTYVQATLYSMFDGEHALVKPNDKIYSIIDKDCKQLEGLPDIAEVGTYEGESYIESDFVDLGKMLAAYKISVDGILGVNTSSTPQQVVQMSVKTEMAYGDKEHPAGSAYWYDYKDNVLIKNVAEGVTGVVVVGFPDNLSRQTYRTKRVIDYYGYYYDYYHDEHIPTGYAWNKINPNTFSLIINNSGRMKGKLRDLFKLISDKFKTFGTVAKQNNGAMVVELKGDRRAVITMSKDNVLAYWGSGLKEAKDIDISKNKDVTEEDDPSNISYGYLNDLFPDKTVDTAVVDTAEVDTVAAY